ncbi:hypothetical protein Syun_031299 [Stephania yunnanensis]|uniref:Uncharacterized protein n=1 Tax=Stephania yunnanensis TaxID=152371 RepID=A0AAP0E189_9MAGN
MWISRRVAMIAPSEKALSSQMVFFFPETQRLEKEGTGRSKVERGRKKRETRRRRRAYVQLFAAEKEEKEGCGRIGIKTKVVGRGVSSDSEGPNIGSRKEQQRRKEARRRRRRKEARRRQRRRSSVAAEENGGG